MADDFRSLSRDLGDVPRTSIPRVRQALEITARKVKSDWRSSVIGARFLKNLYRTIDYDVTREDKTTRAEIGFNKDRKPGALGTISEYGTPRVAGRRYGEKALAANAQDFEDGLDKAIADSLRDANL